LLLFFAELIGLLSRQLSMSLIRFSSVSSVSPVSPVSGETSETAKRLKQAKRLE